MSEKPNYISSSYIKQVALIIVILILVFLIGYNLSSFLPSLLGAITLYVVGRKFNFYLQEKKNWKSHWASLFILFSYLIIFVFPTYFLVDSLISKVGNAQQHIGGINVVLRKVQVYIEDKTGFDLLSKENMTKVQSFVTEFSTMAVGATVDMLTLVSSMFFILYFMFDKPKQFEGILISLAPLKKVNVNLIGEKLRNLVMANAIGIPVVALGQGLVALLAYLFFDVPSPMLMFMLTCLASIIPIVGGAIVYVPICIFMLASGRVVEAFILLGYCVLVVGMVDNVLRFTVLKKLEDIHPLNTVFGIVMGMNLFGFMGLIFGPILVSLTLLLIKIYKNEFVQNDHIPELILNEKDEDFLLKE